MTLFTNPSELKVGDTIVQIMPVGITYVLTVERITKTMVIALHPSTNTVFRFKVYMGMLPGVPYDRADCMNKYKMYHREEV